MNHLQKFKLHYVLAVLVAMLVAVAGNSYMTITGYGPDDLGKDLRTVVVDDDDDGGDGDMDFDRVPDEDDNCPMWYNPMQMDRDSDGLGDICDEQYLSNVPKEEELVLCIPPEYYLPYPPPPNGDYLTSLFAQVPNGEPNGYPAPLCETVVLNGNVTFEVFDQSSYWDEGYEYPRVTTYFSFYTREGQPLTGTSELFGNVQLQLYGDEGSYTEKFPGMDFPADAEVYFSEGWELIVDKSAVCNNYEYLGYESEDDCLNMINEPMLSDDDDDGFDPNKLYFYLGEYKYEWGIVKAFPPFYENPLCTALPIPPIFGDDDDDDGFFYEPIFLYGPQEMMMTLMYNCDEFGTPVIEPEYPTGPVNLTDLNTEVEIDWDFGEGPHDVYKMAGPSSMKWTPSTSDFFGPYPMKTIDSEILSLDLAGVSPFLSDMNDKATEVRMRLLTPDDFLYQYLGFESPFYEGLNHGVEYYLLDIVKLLLSEFSPEHVDFYTELFPMVGGFHMFVAFETDLDGDGDIDTIVPLDMYGETVTPIVLGAYPGKKGVPPYYTPYCTIDNSYILQVLEYFIGYIPNEISLYHVATNGEMILGEPSYVGMLDLMCFEIREEEVCDGRDNDHDGLIDEDENNRIVDLDGDGVNDNCDNCVGIHNPKQVDRDQDGVGNECDNCDNSKNPEQQDEEILEERITDNLPLDDQPEPAVDWSGNVHIVWSEMVSYECEESCYLDCEYGCNQECDLDCDGECSSICDLQCEEDPDPECVSKCMPGCQSGCEEEEQGCFSSCSQSCAAPCLESCDTCPSICQSECDNNCEVECDFGCESGCGEFCSQYEPETPEWDTCMSGCMGGCTEDEESCMTECTDDEDWCNDDCLEHQCGGGYSWEVFYTMLDKDGNVLIEDTQITEADGNNSKRPQVVMDSDKNAHVVWADVRENNCSNYASIFYKKLAPYSDNMDGTPADPTAITLIDDTNLTCSKQLTVGLMDTAHANGYYKYTHPQIDIDGNNDIHVVYENADSFSVYYQKIDNNGGQVVPQTTVFPYSTYLGTPDVAADADGDAHIVWNANYESCNYTVFYKVLDGTNGAELVSTRRISQSGDCQPSKQQSVSVDENGYVNVVWHHREFWEEVIDLRSFGYNSSELYYTRMEVDKEFDQVNKLIDMMQLTPSDGIKSSFPVHVVDSNGNLHITWYEAWQSMSSGFLHYMKVAPNGTILDEEQITPEMTADTAGRFTMPFLTVDSCNSPHVVWADDRYTEYPEYEECTEPYCMEMCGPNYDCFMSCMEGCGDVLQVESRPYEDYDWIMEIMYWSKGDCYGDECDNCPDHYNPSQRDSDRDGLGDACDREDDRNPTAGGGGGGGGGPSEPRPAAPEPEPIQYCLNYLTDPTHQTYLPGRDLTFTDLGIAKGLYKPYIEVLKSSFIIVDEFNGIPALAEPQNFLDADGRQFVISGYAPNTLQVEGEIGAPALGSATVAEIGPNNAANRLEVAKLLMVSHCLPILDTTNLTVDINGQAIPTWGDLPRNYTGDPVMDYPIHVAVSANYYGIWDGYLDGDIGLGDQVTYSQAVKMLVGLREILAGDTTPTVDSPTGNWYDSYYATAGSEGWVSDTFMLAAKAMNGLMRAEGIYELVNSQLAASIYHSGDAALIYQYLNSLEAAEL